MNSYKRKLMIYRSSDFKVLTNLVSRIFNKLIRYNIPDSMLTGITAPNKFISAAIERNIRSLI